MKKTVLTLGAVALSFVSITAMAADGSTAPTNAQGTMPIQQQQTQSPQMAHPSRGDLRHAVMACNYSGARNSNACTQLVTIALNMNLPDSRPQQQAMIARRPAPMAQAQTMPVSDDTATPTQAS